MTAENELAMVFESKLFGHEIDLCLPQATGNCVVFLACYKASRLISSPILALYIGFCACLDDRV